MSTWRIPSVLAAILVVLPSAVGVRADETRLKFLVTEGSVARLEDRKNPDQQAAREDFKIDQTGLFARELGKVPWLQVPVVATGSELRALIRVFSPEWLEAQLRSRTKEREFLKWLGGSHAVWLRIMSYPDESETGIADIWVVLVSKDGNELFRDKIRVSREERKREKIYGKLARKIGNKLYEPRSWYSRPVLWLGVAAAGYGAVEWNDKRRAIDDANSTLKGLPVVTAAERLEFETQRNSYEHLEDDQRTAAYIGGVGAYLLVCNIAKSQKPLSRWSRVCIPSGRNGKASAFIGWNGTSATVGVAFAR